MKSKAILVAGAMAALALLPTVAKAQGYPPQGPGGPGPGGPGGQPGFGGQRGGMGQGRGPGQMMGGGIALVNIPLPALTAYLGLNDEQQDRIAEIQQANRPQPGQGFGAPGGGPGGQGFGGPGRPGDFNGQPGPGGPGGPGNPGGFGPGGQPGPGGQGFGGPAGGPPPPGGQGFGGPGGGPGGPGGFGGPMGVDPRANAQIRAVLNDAQKAKVPALIKEVALFQSANIPIDLVGTLQLTEDQRNRLIIAAFNSRPDFDPRVQEAMETRDPQRIARANQVARENSAKQTRGILTAEQRALIEQWEKEHPRPQPGQGFGGPGGPPQP